METKSRGHQAFISFPWMNTTYEYYLDAEGGLWRAPLSSVIDLHTGNRIGRWEAPAHMAQQWLQNALNAGVQAQLI